MPRPTTEPNVRITAETLVHLERAVNENLMPAKEARLIEQALCEKAFDLVADPNDWKAPINRTIFADTSDFCPEFICHAVQYFTATPCIYKEVTRYGRKCWRFEAAGYRAGPAGP